MMSSYLQFAEQSSYRLDHPNPKTYIGSGKVAELCSDVRGLDIETVIFDDELSPG